MKDVRTVRLLVFGLCALAPAAGAARAAGPNVLVGDIAANPGQPGIKQWGTAGGVAAFSFATTSCNDGDQPLDWNPLTGNHPVIAQNLYRYRPQNGGRFEQLGLSWLKHGFAVASGTVCGNCPVAAGNRLMPGCSDLYSEGLNGNQSSLGPRSEVNPSTGRFRLPHSTPVITPSTTAIAGRLQVKVVDFDMTQTANAGARFFAEAHYIHPQDAAAGNGNDNASYREVRPDTTAPNGFVVAAPVVRKDAAIHAWQAIDPDVRLFNVDVPDDGRFILGVRSSHVGGTWHHELAVHNLNSDRAAKALVVTTAAGTVSNPGFQSPAYHSGEPYDNQAWQSAAAGTGLTWAVVNPGQASANALRWGTLYNFWFDSTDALTSVTIQLLKPGQAGDPAEVSQPIPAGGGFARQEVAGRALWAGKADVEVPVQLPPGGTAELTLSTPGDADRKVTAASNNPQVHVDKVAKGTKDGKAAWTVTLSRDAAAKDAYFEAGIVVSTDATRDRPVKLRVYGDASKK